MRNARKPIFAIAALAIVAALGAGGTLAYFTDEDSQRNTFTMGEVRIELFEHGYDPEANALTDKKVAGVDGYVLVPGTVLPKDPTVTVKAGSEDCWVFVEVQDAASVPFDVNGDGKVSEGEALGFDAFVSYEVDSANWTHLEGDVWYCAAEDVAADRKIKVIGYEDASGGWHPNEVLVRPDVTEQMMKEMAEHNRPILALKAYACQMEGFDSAAEAWEKVKPSS